MRRKKMFMKEIVSILLMMFLALPLAAQDLSVESETVDTTETITKKGYFDFSRWSIDVQGGVNMFDGDIQQYYGPQWYSLWSSVRGGMSLGAVIEHTFNPTLSMGVEAYYLPVRANTKDRMLAENISVSNYIESSSTHAQAAVFLSANLLKAFNKNIKTKWGFWANIGMGGAVFDAHYRRYGEKYSGPNGETLFRLTMSEDLHNKMALIVIVGGNLEYNLTKNLALGVKLNYTTYNRDDLEGSQKDKLNGGKNYAGVTNDFIASAFVNLRWKFTVSRPHTRNITWREYDNEALAAALEALKKQPKNYDARLDSMQQQIDSLRTNVDTLFSEVDRLKMYMVDYGPDTDGDGVPDVRDVDNNTPPNTPVDFFGRAISTTNANKIPAVFFDFDKSNLDADAHTAIAQTAQKLKNDSQLLCEIRAYCDYMGNDQYNLQLSIKRANKVKQELVEIYGINPDRIAANGHGRVLEPPSKYRANRRAEFHFSGR